MWPSNHIRLLVCALAIANIFGPFAYGSPIFQPSSGQYSLSLPSNGQKVELFESPLDSIQLIRAPRMLAADAEDADGDGKPDEKDEAEKEQPDEEKKEEVDEDLKSDEEKDDDDDDDDEDDKVEKKDDDDDSSDEVKSQIDHKLLIILIDGIRFDYVTRDPALKGFPRLAKQGVHAKEVNPVHPSDSYPNYYSILTGLYPENHGFIDNYVRDKSTGEIFLGSPHPNASHPHFWTDAEPLWVTAEKHRIKTAVYGWDGCQVRTENSKKRPPVHVCEQYKGYPGSKKEKSQFRRWLEQITADFKEHKYRLALAYYETVDYTGHKYGPQSRITKQAVRDIDEILYDLQDMLTKNDLDDEVNVYIVSDHGMISSKKFKEIELDDYIDMNDVELVLGAGATIQLLAEKGKHAEVFKRLLQANVKGLNVYEKSSIPERFHLRGDDNLLPIYLTADKGYTISTPGIPSKVYPDLDHDDDGDVEASEMPKGDHGYDSDFVSEMKTIMYAYGPDIRDGQVIEEMDMVDHYGIFCQLLGLEPRPNNGTSEMFDEVLNKFGDDGSSEEGKDKDDDDDDDDSKEDGEKKDKKDDNEDDDDDDDNAAVPMGATWITALFGLIFAIML